MDGVSNDGSVDSVSHNWGGVDSVVGHGVGNDWGVDSVSDSGSVVGGGSGVVVRVLGLAVVGDISNVSIVTIDVVVDVLDSAIRKSHGVSTLDIAGTIGSLLSVEVSLGVVVSDGVGEGVGGDLIGVGLGLVGGSGLVSNGSWGISGGSVDGVSNNGGMVNHWGVDSVDGVVDRGVVEHVLHSSIGTSGSNGEDSSSNKSLKYKVL